MLASFLFHRLVHFSQFFLLLHVIYLSGETLTVTVTAEAEHNVDDAVQIFRVNRVC
jgi:hypothetical protein